MRRNIKLAAFAVAILLFAISLFNASWLAPTPVGAIRLIAHRGVAQQFPRTGVNNDTCTALRIEPPMHDRLENTARSIEDAVNQGADMIEVDVAPTKDGKIALFHDWALDCRTEAKGDVRDLTLAQLQALDPGHGYSADGGKTFPLRGQRKYPIPALSDALRAAPRTPIMFNFKSKSAGEADLMAAELKAAKRDIEAIGDAFYGDPGPVDRIHHYFPKAWGWTKPGVKACTKGYMLKGWFGIVPAECRGGTFIIPLNFQWMVPGWPNRALARFKAADTKVIVIGPRSADGMLGLSLPEQLGKIPSSYKGFVWVEDIWTVGPALRASKDIRTQVQVEASEAALAKRRARQ
ncbi:MAG: glycerophosphodiester phosphodiesterase family protein [Sphingomicrobium sp.]